MPDEPNRAASIRYMWLKVMYVANVVISGPIGAGALLVPETLQTLMGLPPQEPIHFGIATGAVPFGFALAGVWGLRAPVKASPILLLQAAYKSLFLLGVALPMAVRGAFPGYAMPIVAIFVFFIIGNVTALPFGHLFASLRTGETSPTETTRTE